MEEISTYIICPEFDAVGKCFLTSILMAFVKHLPNYWELTEFSLIFLLQIAIKFGLLLSE